MDVSLYAMHISGAVNAFLLPLAIIVVSLDPLCFILEDLHLNSNDGGWLDRLFWSCVYVIRFISTAFAVAESSRYTQFFADVMFLFLNNLEHYIVLIQHQGFDAFYVSYTKLVILMTFFRKYASSQNFIFLSTFFWLGVFTMWVVFKGFGKIHVFIHLAAALFSLFSFQVAFFVLANLIKITNLTKTRLSEQMIIMSQETKLFQRRQHKIKQKRLRNLQPIVFYYGQIERVDEEMFSGYWFHFTDNLVSSLLLFDLF